jgi:hypothetical protein
MIDERARVPAPDSSSESANAEQASVGGIDDEHACCGHGRCVLEGGSGCCAPGHSAYLLATGQRAE